MSILAMIVLFCRGSSGKRKELSIAAFLPMIFFKLRKLSMFQWQNNMYLNPTSLRAINQPDKVTTACTPSMGIVSTALSIATNIKYINESRCIPPNAPFPRRCANLLVQSSTKCS